MAYIDHVHIRASNPSRTIEFFETFFEAFLETFFGVFFATLFFTDGLGLDVELLAGIGADKLDLAWRQGFFDGLGGVLDAIAGTLVIG